MKKKKMFRILKLGNLASFTDHRLLMVCERSWVSEIEEFCIESHENVLLLNMMQF